MTEHQILFFVATSLVVIATPGQDMVLVMSRSIAQGSRAGVVTALGVSLGLMGHTCLAAFGLGAILSTSEIAFLVVKLIGAGYLIYLGGRMILSSAQSVHLDSLTAIPFPALFRQGAVSNLANPKVTVFYFAFLPQFVPQGEASPTLLLLFLGASFSVLTFMVKAPVGYGAGALSGWLRQRPRIQVWMNRISGCVLVGLGIRLGFAQRI